MLGVRYSTYNDVCYVESGYTPLKAIVKSRQRKFFTKMYNSRIDMNDDPLGLALRLVLDTRYSTRRYVSDLINTNIYAMQPW